MSIPNYERQRIYRVCQDCAATVFPGALPTGKYIVAVTDQLFGIAAVESGLIWERQRSPRWEGQVGAVSKWQMEMGSLTASLNDLRKNPMLNARAIRFVFQDTNAPGDAIYCKTAAEWFDILRIGDCDGPGALFARLHLLRCPGPIPDSLEGQAAYWKKHYNTILGKGTEEGYISAFLRLRPTPDA